MNDDVRERARAAAIKRCLADCYDVPLEQTQLTEECTNAASSMLAALDAAGIALVDAEELRALREFWQWSEVMEIVAMSPAETLRAVLCPARDAVADIESEGER